MTIIEFSVIWKLKLKIQRDDRIFISGRSGSGKTYLAKEIVRKNKAYKFVIIDILGNYQDLAKQENVYHFVIDPLDEETLNRIIKAGLSESAFFVIDEFHSFPFLKYKNLRYLILVGRNYGSGWLAITQFPALVPKSVIGNANLSFIFANYEKNVVKYLSSTYDISEEELRALQGHEFYIAHYSDVMRDSENRPIKFIL